ncbi:hypothetical protein C8F04DRAFT_1272312 [Mycena alexandri]|uniref:Uncharacterized protein n=1 Tax=Mycena alexandri TaxID=1745969 RepID=A0AAD6S8S9_9AGAR|nr:hypothetical protein C8F04DRAFT_1272312 [Mycena alexandri]
MHDCKVWMHASSSRGEATLISQSIKLKPMISMFIHVVGYTEVDTGKKLSHSQREFIARHHDIVPLLRSVDTAWHILSLSIITTTSFTSTHGTVPLYTEHAVITIASMLSRKDMETIPISFNPSWKNAPSLSGRLLFDLQKHVQEAVLNKLGRPTTSLTDIARAKSWKRYTEGYYVGKHVNPELQNEVTSYRREGPIPAVGWP